MRIHIVLNQDSMRCDELLIKRIALLFKSIKLDYPLQDFDCTHVNNIGQGADLYFEIISEQEVRMGFMPETSGLRWTSTESVWRSDDLHWVKVMGASNPQPNLIAQIVFFIIGLLCVPSQTGAYMADLTDLKIALQHGSQASLTSVSQLDKYVWSSANKVSSSIMLFNEAGSISKKLEVVANLIPQSHLKHNYLNIMNITNTNHLPKSNQLLLIY